MKIIEPSAHIIEDELAQLSVYQRIDRCSSVCYQRPPKDTEEEAQAFCKSMLERKHMMPMEMMQLHLVVEGPLFKHKESLLVKYINIDNWSPDYVIISGSIRAFIEWLDGEQDWCDGMDSVGRFLNDKFPCIFNDHSTREVDIYSYTRFAQPHEIPWQHKYVAVRIICSRAISHQLVRHRPCSILQESQRYCRYDGKRFKGEVKFIKPIWVPGFSHTGNNNKLFLWRDTMLALERRCFDLLSNGCSPQEARGVLPNDCKTELIMYASLPEWQHILNTKTMRCSPHADPEMRRIMVPLREEFKMRYPEVEW